MRCHYRYGVYADSGRRLVAAVTLELTVFADGPQCSEKIWARPAGSDAQKRRPDASANHHFN